MNLPPRGRDPRAQAQRPSGDGRERVRRILSVAATARTAARTLNSAPKIATSEYVVRNVAQTSAPACPCCPGEGRDRQRRADREEPVARIEVFREQVREPEDPVESL